MRLLLNRQGLVDEVAMVSQQKRSFSLISCFTFLRYAGERATFLLENSLESSSSLLCCDYRSQLIVILHFIDTPSNEVQSRVQSIFIIEL